MSVAGNKLWVTSGGKDDTWNNIFSKGGVYLFQDEKWTSFIPDNLALLDTVFDYISVAIDPANSNIAYIGTWSKGMLVFKNKEYYSVYNESNSTLRPFSPTPNYSMLRVGGICFDANKNMWLSNPGADKPLSVKKPGLNGQWYSFKLNGINTQGSLSTVIIDKYNQKWILVPRGVGLLVFNDNNTIENSTDDKSKILVAEVGRGNLPSNDVFSLSIDLDGEIWVGTSKGVGVFYSPQNVFTNDNFDAQPITLEQDGYVQYLLETETVSAIAVDGANRKWLGTLNAGVFLMSADGTKQIAHFTTDNSPLFSNTINDIAINQNTGEVFIGTNMGLISYRAEATVGKETFVKKDVYAFPNPFSFSKGNSTIAIKGLVKDAKVKITDISGNLVYTAVASGGQVVWNAYNLQGEKTNTGVYLVFCTNDDGSETMVTKVLIVN